jgi:predicted nucleic acid-binding protein
MNLFLDTNVLIDFLSDRKPYSESAGKLFTLSLNKKIRIFISAISYNNVYYILRQSLTNKETIGLLKELSEMTEVIHLTKNVLKNALKSDFKDFEDAIQYYSALTNSSIEKMVTRNTKDFKLSEIPVMTPEEVLGALSSNII